MILSIIFAILYVILMPFKFHASSYLTVCGKIVKGAQTIPVFRVVHIYGLLFVRFFCIKQMEEWM